MTKAEATVLAKLMGNTRDEIGEVIANLRTSKVPAGVIMRLEAAHEASVMVCAMAYSELEN